MESAIGRGQAVSAERWCAHHTRRHILDSLVIALFGGIALVGAVLMLVLREPMRVALALVTTMMSLGAIYGFLGVHFIAAFQVLIYVGAVMVFMVFVIMLLEVREARGSKRYSNLVVPGAVVFAMLSGVLGVSVWSDMRPGAAISSPAGEAFDLVPFSTAFLRDYWLQFELTTVLLVAAIVAAIAVIKVHRRVPDGVPASSPERSVNG